MSKVLAVKIYEIELKGMKYKKILLKPKMAWKGFEG